MRGPSKPLQLCLLGLVASRHLMTAFLFSFCTAETDQLHLLCQACAVCLAQVMWLFLKWNVSRTGGPVVRGTSRALRHAGELGACALITHSFPGRPEVPEQGALCSFAFVQLMCSPSRRSRKYVLVPPEVLIQQPSTCPKWAGWTGAVCGHLLCDTTTAVHMSLQRAGPSQFSIFLHSWISSEQIL